MPQIAKSAFGEHLRREREMRGVSLDEITVTTRIGRRFLEALENEQWERLPGGVFNRGFVRGIARFLGLDEEDLLAEYELATNDRPAATLPADIAAQGGRPRHRPWLLAWLAVALAAGGWFAWHRYSTARAVPSAASGSVSGQTTYQSFGARPAMPGVDSPPSSPVPPRASSAQAASLSATAVSPGLLASRPAPLDLKIEAGRTTAVRVTADGKRIFNGQMTAGRSQRFRAQEKFEISVRNATAVLLELNGQTLAPLGPPGRPGKVTLTRKDLKQVPGGPD